MSLIFPACREEDGQWKEDQKLEAHSDWVRDVGWAPSIGLPTSTIASCSQVRFDVITHAEHAIYSAFQHLKHKVFIQTL